MGSSLSNYVGRKTRQWNKREYSCEFPKGKTNHNQNTKADAEKGQAVPKREKGGGAKDRQIKTRADNQYKSEPIRRIITGKDDGLRKRWGLCAKGKKLIKEKKVMKHVDG